MAKVSRFKQPAFDPTEIDDLIHVPAVGTGVGSHLLTKEDDVPSPSTPRELKFGALRLSTVDTSKTRPSDLDSAVSISNKLDLVRNPSLTTSTVVFEPDKELTSSSLTTVDTSNIATVDRFREIALNLCTVVTFGEAISSQGDAATVQGEESNLPTVDTPRSSDGRRPVWITESGEMISHGRVKRIQLAQDVINSGEESVYDELWKAKGAIEMGDARVVQAGYDYLAKRTRLARKTIQRIVAKLIDKDFIAIERPADIYERSATCYRVFSYRTVLERHKTRGRTHVAKVGPGFSYVQRLEDPRRQQDKLNMSTVATTHMSTVASEAIVTVAKNNLSTVVRETTSFLDKENIDNVTSLSLVQEVLNEYGAVDDDVCGQLIHKCRQHVPDCTAEEIVKYIHAKGRFVRTNSSTIRNPIGFFLESVPKCFASKQYRDWREEQQRLQAEQVERDLREQEELEEWSKEQRIRLDDPQVTEDEKQLIRKWMGAGK